MSKKPVIKVTPNNVNNWLVGKPGFLEQSILLLFSRQEGHEQEVFQTIDKNHRGFNNRNAKMGSVLAQKLLHNEGWTSAERTRARDICFTHAVQIAKMMNN